MRSLLILCLLLLSACGQRGALYLPDEGETQAVLETGEASAETGGETDRESPQPAPGNGEGPADPDEDPEDEDPERPPGSGTGR